MEELPWGGARGMEATPWSEVQWRAGPPRPSSDTAEPYMFFGEEERRSCPWYHGV